MFLCGWMYLWTYAQQPSRVRLEFIGRHSCHIVRCCLVYKPDDHSQPAYLNVDHFQSHGEKTRDSPDFASGSITNTSVTLGEGAEHEPQVLT